jgi:hypothetical protein
MSIRHTYQPLTIQIDDLAPGCGHLPDSFRSPLRSQIHRAQLHKLRIVLLIVIISALDSPRQRALSLQPETCVLLLLVSISEVGVEGYVDVRGTVAPYTLTAPYSIDPTACRRRTANRWAQACATEYVSP